MAMSDRFSNAMNNLARLDSSLQRGLDNAMARVFRSRLVPAELEELVKQEAEDNATRTEDGFVEAPNVFKISVSSNDFKNLRDRFADLPTGFADQMTRFSRNSGWSLVGPVVVLIAEDSSRRTGQLSCISERDPDPELQSGFFYMDGNRVVDGMERQAAMVSKNSDDRGEEFSSAQRAGGESVQEPRPDTLQTRIAAPATPAPPKQPQQPEQPIPSPEPFPPRPARVGPTVTLLLQDGSSRSYVVREGSNVIGRSNDADFRLPDTGVSREHAEVTWDGRDAILVDLQSTNGTTVNDVPIDNWLLADGDVITVGHSNIEVRIVGA